MLFDNGLAVDTFVGLLILIVFHLVWDYFSDRRARRNRAKSDKFCSDLNQLCSLDTAIVSVSRSEDGPVTVSVIDDWTEYTETCFIQASMEDAVEEALAYKRSRV